MSNEAISVSSGTKTKTAQLSGNDFSVELRKINQASFEQKRKIQGAEEEDEVNQSDPDQAQLDSVGSAPPGFGKVKSQAPPGLFGSSPLSVNPSSMAKASPSPKGTPVVSRASKSQKKQGRKKSMETTESMIQVAEEALAVGELLGVKVISQKENAIKRITDTLKSSRVTRSMKARQQHSSS